MVKVVGLVMGVEEWKEDGLYGVECLGFWRKCAGLERCKGGIDGAAVCVVCGSDCVVGVWWGCCVVGLLFGQWHIGQRPRC
jgi:hypothetical protein